MGSTTHAGSHPLETGLLSMVLAGNLAISALPYSAHAEEPENAQAQAQPQGAMLQQQDDEANLAGEAATEGGSQIVGKGLQNPDGEPQAKPSGSSASEEPASSGPQPSSADSQSTEEPAAEASVLSAAASERAVASLKVTSSKFPDYYDKKMPAGTRDDPVRILVGESVTLDAGSSSAFTPWTFDVYGYGESNATKYVTPTTSPRRLR